MSNKAADPRRCALRAITAILEERASLAGLAPFETDLEGRDRAFFRDLCYGSFRWLHRNRVVIDEQLSKPLRKRDRDVLAALLLGCYQLLQTDTPAHAAISTSVNLIKRRKSWAGGLVNACLRNVDRQLEALPAQFSRSEEYRHSHPQWLLEQIRASWPHQADAIFEANNQRAPLTLRASGLHQPRSEALARLLDAGLDAAPGALSKTAIYLAQATDVGSIPGFEKGHFSVQDEASQLAVEILGAGAGERLLDACSAPGGKTGHLLELAPTSQLLALDNVASRLALVADNLGRLGLQADLREADAGRPDGWWDGQPFDRILLDAPCSASGVIRRHPDIKWLRNQQQLDALIAQQQRLLDALWPTLAEGGRLLYTTCSVLSQENSGQIHAFLERTPSAKIVEIPGDWGEDCSVGRQLLPRQQGNDGFYYALLTKVS